MRKKMTRNRLREGQKIRKDRWKLYCMRANEDHQVAEVALMDSPRPEDEKILALLSLEGVRNLHELLGRYLELREPRGRA